MVETGFSDGPLSRSGPLGYVAGYVMTQNATYPASGGVYIVVCIPMINWMLHFDPQENPTVGGSGETSRSDRRLNHIAHLY